jgi:protein subunit release factor B
MAEQKDRTKIGTVTAKDCEWQYFRAGGKGGQSQNKTNSGVRVIHHASGARGESREHKSQFQNRQTAWRRMAMSKEFLTWVKKEAGHDAAAASEMKRRIDAAVSRQILSENLLIETKNEHGEWVVTDEKDLT